MKELELGLFAEKSFPVEEKHTAAHLGSGGVPVYATPTMVLHMEETALGIVDPFLGKGRATVGASICVKHLAPTPVGMTVRIRAELVGIEGRKYVFRIEAWDEGEKIGEADHVRVAMDLDRLGEKIAKKRAAIAGSRG
ncbi:MAG: thioesterase family protein [Rectinemataceae bacterium]